MFRKIFLWLTQRTTAAVASAPAPSSDTDPISNSTPNLPFIRIVELADPAPYAGKLFLKKFGHPVPNYPRSFVAFYRQTEKDEVTVGYVHYLPFENVYLCGGMCVDSAAYRHMPNEHMKKIREAGSLAEYMLRVTFGMVGPCAAIFGSVGDATARNVDLRAGFIDTGEPKLMVVWRDASEHEKPELIRRVLALGSF